MLPVVELVHVFSSAGRFVSADDLQDFVGMTWTDDGTEVPSPFAREIQLQDHEPACLECVQADTLVPLRDLLDGASYADQWLEHLDPDLRADAVICVFSPNKVRNPRGSSLTYCGAFGYTT